MGGFEVKDQAENTALQLEKLKVQNAPSWESSYSPGSSLDKRGHVHGVCWGGGKAPGAWLICHVDNFSASLERFPSERRAAAPRRCAVKGRLLRTAVLRQRARGHMLTKDNLSSTQCTGCNLQRKQVDSA